MTEKEAPKSIKPIQDIGPIGHNARAVIAKRRKELGKTAVDLSKDTEKFGRKLSPVSIRRIEGGGRRIDLDDLIVLALALDISPVTMLLPKEFPYDQHDLFRVISGNDYAYATLRVLWGWVTGVRAFNPQQTDKEFQDVSLPKWYLSADESKDLQIEALISSNKAYKESLEMLMQEKQNEDDGKSSGGSENDL